MTVRRYFAAHFFSDGIQIFRDTQPAGRAQTTTNALSGYG